MYIWNSSIIMTDHVIISNNEAGSFGGESIIMAMRRFRVVLLHNNPRISVTMNIFTTSVDVMRS